MPDILQGRVAEILNEREVVINIGANNGVQPGMKFAILGEQPHVIVDPQTQEELGQVDRPKARVKVSQVHEKFAVARTYETYSVNVGGYGPDFSQILGVGKYLEPPKWVTKVKNLRVDESDLPGELTPEQSIVKVNDRVTQILPALVEPEPRRPTFEISRESLKRAEKEFTPDWRIRLASGDYVASLDWRFRGPRFPMEWRSASGSDLERTHVTAQFDLANPPGSGDDFIGANEIGLEIRFHWDGDWRSELHCWPLKRNPKPDKTLWEIGAEIMPPLFFDE